jgi:hypothetical protein
MDAVAPWSLGRSPNFVFGPQDEHPALSTSTQARLPS